MNDTDTTRPVNVADATVDWAFGGGNPNVSSLEPSVHAPTATNPASTIQAA